MDLSTFIESLKNSAPPEMSVYLKALWYDAKDNWKAGHKLIDRLEDKKACWVHGYLHRKEGDLWNADYWYSRADRRRPTMSLQEEWEDLLDAFLDEPSS